MARRKLNLPNPLAQMPLPEHDPAPAPIAPTQPAPASPIKPPAQPAKATGPVPAKKIASKQARKAIAPKSKTATAPKEAPKAPGPASKARNPAPVAPPAFTLRVPASTSNLGPGFDCLGLALNLHNEFVIVPAATSATARYPHTLSGTGRLNGMNLTTATAVRGNPFFELFERVGQLAGRTLPRVKVTVNAQVPPGVGLGSSATARVAGAMAANHLLGNPFSSEQLLTLVIEAEGHPDNATPAMCGGLTLTARTPAGPLVHIYEAHPDWRVVLHVPDYEIATRDARGKLPATVGLEDAAFGLPRVAMVIDALITGDASILGRVMEDRLHEPARALLIKGYEKLKGAALGAGAAAVFISGAGSGLAALCLGDDVADGVAETLCDASAKLKISNDALKLNVQTAGAVVVAA